MDMSFLLKIVEGPNKGAEIALVEGVAVTLGKGDDCDIVLADATLPAEPLSIEASADGVTVGGEPLAPFAVKTLGATSFAVGPADAPWGPLEWPSDPASGADDSGASAPAATGPAPAPAADAAAKPGDSAPSADAPDKPRRRRFPWVVPVAVLLLLLLALAWFLRGAGSGSSGPSGASADPGSSEIGTSAEDALAEKYGLTLDGGKLTGNFATRRERLAATAELYASRPGVDLDLSDDESFRTACEDALFTLTEGAMKVASATNRVLALTGTSPSPDALARTVVALRADLPKLRDIDVSGVTFTALGRPTAARSLADSGAGGDTRPTRRARSAASATPSLPVCGILTSPYPCLVMRDGRRLMEGASVGDGVILEIGADSVVVTNSAGRFTWRP